MAIKVHLASGYTYELDNVSLDTLASDINNAAKNLGDAVKTYTESSLGTVRITLLNVGMFR